MREDVDNAGTPTSENFIDFGNPTLYAWRSLRMSAKPVAESQRQASDYLAPGCIDVIHDFGQRTPDNIGGMTFYNYTLSRQTIPSSPPWTFTSVIFVYILPISD